MAAKKIARPPRGNITLGGEQAEADPLLREGGFFATGSYLAVESRDDRHCFLLGRTGSGKSALLQQLEDTRTHVIRIRPEDLSLTYITDLQVLRYLSSLGVHLDPLFIALWKHVLLIEIIKDRYNVDSGEASSVFLPPCASEPGVIAARQLPLSTWMNSTADFGARPMSV